MSITVNDASAVLRQAVRDTIRKRSLLFLIQGGVMVAAGVLALLFPALMSTGLIELLGWLLIISGIFQSISLIGATQVPYFWMQLVSTVLEIIVGYLLIAHPDAGIFAVMLLMLVLFMVGGIARVVFALMIRPMPDWGWILASGVVAIVCSIILIGSLPEAAAWLLGILLGLQLITGGGALAFLAWRVRKSTSPDPSA
ncbi:MAG: HdeD family acid-resistance protein [Pseudomonadota bacterium]